VHDVWLIGTSILGEIGIATVIYGLLAVVGAVLAGPTAPATALRRLTAPFLNRRPAVVALAMSVLYLMIVLWGPTHALRTWWGVLVLGALFAAGIVTLRRQTQLEFADDAGTGLVIALMGGVSTVGAAQPAADPEASPSVVVSRADELSRLADLRDAGAISEDEFVRAKELVLH
jgi:hypothetical protein